MLKKIKTRNFTYKKQSRFQYWENLINSKKNPNRRKYFAFFLKKRSNVFITITNIKGEVVTSRSAGVCKITTKKRKKSWDTLKAVAAAAAKTARLKNIRYIYKFFMSIAYSKNAKIIHKSFREQGLFILKPVLIRRKPFSLPMKKKKPKRL